MLNEEETSMNSLTEWKPSRPFWQVALDIMGPLPKNDGFKYFFFHKKSIFKIVQCSSYAESRCKNGSNFFQGLLGFPIWVPANLYCDKGKNFMSHIFENICKELGTDRNSTTACHPQGKAMIERTNETIKESLANYV